MENLDIRFDLQQHQNRTQVLQRYSYSLRQLRNYAERNYRLRPYVFDNYVFFQYFQQRSDATGTGNDEGWSTFLKMELLNHILDRRRQILYWILYLLLFVSCVLVYNRESAVAVTEQSVHQTMVYPGMRMWRRMTLPLIERFPRLTELYDESCLMDNPFFQIDDLNCSPCAQVESVIDLSEHLAGQLIDADTALLNVSKLGNVPFIFKVSYQEPLNLQDFYRMYSSNQKIFQRDAYRIQSTNPLIGNLEELFREFNQSQKAPSHNLWRCNRMVPARLLRQLIARPVTLPPSMALERYMTIDMPHAPSYTLPNTECPHVYVQQASGARLIILRPTSECRHNCRTLSVRLPSSYVLSYNWWYWKPISAQDPMSNIVSISLIGSYC